MNLLLRVSNYISRYAPSEKKLREYISKKKPTFHISDFLKEIGYDESLMCDMWMRTFLSRSTPEREIQIKLTKKGFPRELIISKVEVSLSEIRDWTTHAREIDILKDTLLRKGKSSQFIRMTLSLKYPYFRDEIESLLEGISDATGLEKEISKYRQKYNLSIQSERGKFFNALQRKGFRYDSIKAFLKDERENTDE